MTPEQADAILGGELFVGARVEFKKGLHSFTGTIKRINRNVHILRDDGTNGSGERIGVRRCWTTDKQYLKVIGVG